MPERKRILITGATGFVGQAIARRFLSDESFDVLFQGRRGVFPGGRREAAFRTDLADDGGLEILRGIESLDILIHCAGLAHQFSGAEREAFRRANVQGTENVCRLAETLGVRHFVLISSVAVYGRCGPEGADENSVCRPEGFYAESKLEAERAAAAFLRKKNIPLTILRLATVIGEGDRGNVTRLITLIEKGVFFWIGDGANKKTLIYKDDAAEAVHRVVKKKREDFEVFNVAAEPVAMSGIVTQAAESLGKRPPRKFLPQGLLSAVLNLNDHTLRLERLRRLSALIDKWLSEDVYLNNKLYEQYGFSPPTPIFEALDRQVRHYLEEKKETGGQLKEC